MTTPAQEQPNIPAKTISSGLDGINTQAGGFMPAFRTFDEVFRWCDMISRSSMVPKAYQNKPFDIMVSVQFGTEIGLKWLQSLQSIAVVNGTPSIYGDAVLGLVRSSGLLEDFDEWLECEGVRQTGSFPILTYADEGKSIVAFCLSKRKGMSKERLTSYSVDDAKRAKLWEKKKVFPNGDVVESPWCTVPARMLMFRARSFNLRDNFGDVLKGLPIYEEAIDFDSHEPPKVTDMISAASQVSTKGVQVLEKLQGVAQERGVETSTQPALQKAPAGQPVAEEASKQAQEQPKQAQERSEPANQGNLQASDSQAPTEAAQAAEPPKQAPATDSPEWIAEQTRILQAIQKAEASLKETEPGKKKYQAVLSVMKVRLSGKQAPLDVLPRDMRGFYLAQLERAVTSMKSVEK